MSHAVYRKDDLLCCAHISGPSHNWLGLKLVTHPVSDMIMTQLEIRAHPTALDEDLIRLAVNRGLELENVNSGSTWYIAEIAYVSDDSPRYSVYEMLARRIVSAMNDGDVASSEHSLT